MNSVEQADKKQWSSKAVIIVSAIATSLLTGIVTFFVQTWTDESARRDESRVVEITSFVESGQSYRELSSAFMQQFTQNEKFKVQRDSLLQNVRSQYGLIETAKANLEGGQFNDAEAYQAKLATLIRLLSQNTEPKNSEVLVQALMDTLNDEVCITYYLRSEAGLPVSSETGRQCHHS